MKKDRVLIVIFICFLVLPLLAYPAVRGHIDTENHENRVLAEMPDLSSGIRFFERLGEYFSDHLPYKNQFVSVHSNLFMSLFRSTANPRVVVGDDGWLFYNNYDAENPIDDILGISSFSLEETEQIKSNLSEAAAKLSGEGRQFVFLLPPNKETVYSEYLPDYLRERKTDETRAEILAGNIVPDGYLFIYPEKELTEEKDRYTLYYKYDTHWNRLGGYVGFRAVCSGLGIDLPELDELSVQESWDYPKDLSELAGIGYKCSDDSEYLLSGLFDSVTVEAVSENGATVYTSDAENDLTVLLIHDSYFKSMIDYYPRVFTKVISADRNYYDLQSVQDYIDIYDPDIVIMEVVERGIQILLHEDMPY